MRQLPARLVKKVIAFIMGLFVNEYSMAGYKIQDKSLSKSSLDNISSISKNHPNGGHT